MTAPIPAPRDLTEILQENRTIIGHLFWQTRFDSMSSEQRSTVLRILTLTAATSLKLAEIAHADALGRNGLVDGGAKGDTEGDKIRAETAMLAAEIEKIRMETEKLKAETARAAAEEERLTVEVLKLKAQSSYNEYLASRSI